MFTGYFVSVNTQISISSLFSSRISKHAELIAIRFNNQNVTYRQLWIVSRKLSIQFSSSNNQAADKSSNLNVSNHACNQTIALLARRTPALVAIILACCNAGITFIVIDEAYPLAYKKKIIAKIKPQLIVGIDCLLGDLRQMVDEQLNPHLIVVDNGLFYDDSGLFDGDSRDSVVTKNLEFDSSGDSLRDTLAIDDERIAYLLMTSGSSGEPKYIKTSHAPLCHFVNWYIKQFSVTAGTKFSMLSGLSHDPLLRDIFVPLASGGEICIPSQETLFNSKLLIEWFGAAQIAFSHVTPQLLRVLCANNQRDFLPHLKYVMSGGDILRRAHVDDLNKISPNCKLVNFYGATETPQAMAFYCVDSTKLFQHAIPVGYAIDDVKLRVLDDHFTEVDYGVEGQIAIETNYLSQGYWSETARTASSFVILNNSLVKAYLTGDYGYKQHDGALVVNGRLDDQVKIRGFRVELSVVHKAVETVSPTLNFIVLAQKTQNQENAIVVFCQITPQHNETNTDVIKKALAITLPTYMQPQHYIWLDKLPLLPNGKIDRSQLFDIFQQQISTQSSIVSNEMHPNNSLDHEFSAILGLKTIESNQSFNMLGGDSLSFIQLSTMLEKKLGYLPNNWENTSIHHLNNLAKRNVRYSQINTTILIRATSILLIVLEHLYSIDIALTTLVLLMISGASLAKYQFSQLRDAENNIDLTKTIKNIVLPTLVISVVIQLFKRELHFPSLFFISNIVDPTIDYTINYWFIYVLVQCMLIIMLLFKVEAIKRLFIHNKFNFCIYASLLSLALAFIGAFFLNKPYPFNMLPHMLIWQIFLGMAMIYANSNKQKLFVLATTFLMTTGVWIAGKYLLWLPVTGFLMLVKYDVPWFPTFAVALMLFMPVLKLPFWASRPINLVASSSMFIYLVHWPLANYLLTIPFLPKGLRLAMMTVAFGVLLSVLWDKTLSNFYQKIIKP